MEINLEIVFLSLKDKAFIDNRKKVQASYGALTAKKLYARLDDIQAASCMEDMRLLPGKWEELTRDRKGQFSAQLDGGYRLIVIPAKQPPPAKADGGLDWKAIDGLIYIEVVDYHG